MQEVVSLLQHTSQTWERLLWTSGGLLNLEKCAYYIIHFEYDQEGRPSYVPKTDMPKLSLTSGADPATTEVDQLDFDEVHKYLGNHLTGNMDMNESFESLLTKSNNFAYRMMSSNLSKYDA